MKNNNKKSERYVTNLPKCWIVSNDNYIFHTKEEERLPVIQLKYLPILEKLSIPYKKVKLGNGIEVLEYWSADLYEEEEITLPVYMLMFGEYRHVEKYTGKIPTKETCETAHTKVKALVQQELKLYQKQEECNWIKEKLSSKEAVYISRLQIEYKFLEDTEITCGNERFSIFVIKNGRGKPTEHMFIFDLNKIENNMKVYIEIPRKEFIPYIVGNNGCNLKRMVSKLGIKKIYLF